MNLIVLGLAWLISHRHQHTNATFWRRGTLQLNTRALPPRRWHYRPGYQRVGIKLGCFVAAVIVPWWWFTHPAIHAVTIVVTLVTVSAVIEVTSIRWYATRQHIRHVVEPLHGALSHLFGDDSPLNWSAWLTVPTDYAEETTSGARLELPPGRSIIPELKVRITEAVSQKLGISDLDTRWQLAGNEPFATFKPVPQAPRKVSFQDVEVAIRQAADTAPVVGIAKFGSLVSLDLEDESPHIMISAGSGGGKSVLAKALIAQFLARGARVIIMDRKRISHRWAKDLPGVEYYRDTEQIHDKLVSLAKIGDIRNRQTDDGDREFQRIILVFEEMNATMGKLTTHWAAIREKEDPKRSPALEALGDLVNMGRQVSMHVIAIGQRIETRTLGGGDVRESFGLRCLSRYSVQTWKMLCADVWPMPRKSPVRGRWQIVAAGQATETQVAFLTDEEAQALARTACPSVPRAADQADKPVGTTVGTPAPDLISLRDHFAGDYDRRRKQLQRDPAAPQPASAGPGGATLYRRSELEAWTAQRDSARHPEPTKAGT